MFLLHANAFTRVCIYTVNGTCIYSPALWISSSAWRVIYLHLQTCSPKSYSRFSLQVHDTANRQLEIYRDRPIIVFMSAPTEKAVCLWFTALRRDVAIPKWTLRGFSWARSTCFFLLKLLTWAVLPTKSVPPMIITDVIVITTLSIQYWLMVPCLENPAFLLRSASSRHIIIFTRVYPFYPRVLF